MTLCVKLQDVLSLSFPHQNVNVLDELHFLRFDFDLVVEIVASAVGNWF